VHATAHFFRRSIAGEAPDWAAALADRLYPDPPAGFCVLGEFGGREGAAVSFWPTRADAERAAGRSVDGGPLPLDVTVSEVVESHFGTAPADTAAVAQLTVFDGPRSQAQADAAERAGRDRLWPATRDIPGVVAVHVLRDDGNGVVVISLATGVEVLEAAQRAVLSTQLLPDEDPALLSDPDRVQVHRVLAARLPETALSGTAKAGERA
jgi:hypothetical protein